MAIGLMAVECEEGDRGAELGPQFEVIFGAPSETITLPYDQYVLFPQTRRHKNSVHDELVDSIKRKLLNNNPDDHGLINASKATAMTHEQLVEHAAFTSSMLGEDIDVSDYLHLQQEDGLFYVVTYGSSRFRAIGDVINDLGYSPSRAGVTTTRTDFVSTIDFFADQVAENIHSRPPKEDEARSIVGLYREGVRLGLWKNGADFRRQGAGMLYSETQVYDALAFDELPREISAFIFGGDLNYSVGVQLGRACRIYRKYLTKRFAGSDLDIEETFKQRIVTMAATMASTLDDKGKPRQRMSVARCMGLIGNETRRWNEYLHDSVIELELYSPEESARIEAKKVKEEYEKFVEGQLRGVRSAPEHVIGVLNVITDYMGDDTSERAADAVKALQEGAGRAAAMLSTSREVIDSVTV